MSLLPGDGWEPETAGESATEVFRRGDVFAKCCGVDGVADLVAERDRVDWLAGTGIAGARLLDWIDGPAGAALLTSAVPGVAAVELPWSERLSDSFAAALREFHELPVETCPFERRLADAVTQAEDVVRRGAVNPQFLTDEWRQVAPEQLLAELHTALPAVQASAELVVCHGDACLPNFLFDPETLECTGAIDVGRLGIADRYADLALVKAQFGDVWSVDASGFFTTYGVTPDPRRLAFYRLLDSLTWG